MWRSLSATLALCRQHHGVEACPASEHASVPDAGAVECCLPAEWWSPVVGVVVPVVGGMTALQLWIIDNDHHLMMVVVVWVCAHALTLLLQVYFIVLKLDANHLIVE